MAAKEIQKIMFELGERFADLAKNEDSIKRAKPILDLADKAFKLSLQAEKQVTKAERAKPIDFTLAYLSSLQEEAKRSQVWQDYLEFCLGFGFQPLKKSDFFCRLTQYGFKTPKRSEVLVVLPTSPPKALVNARKDYDLITEPNQDPNQDSDPEPDSSSI